MRSFATESRKLSQIKEEYSKINNELKSSKENFNKLSTEIDKLEKLSSRLKEETNDLEVKSQKYHTCRDPNNSIVIDHPSVSPFHAEILLVHSEDRYEVFDLGSPNGTKVNGEQVIRKELENGDQINFGKLKAEILLNSSPNTQNSDTAPVKKEKVPSVARASKKPPIPKLVKTPPTKGEEVTDF